MTTIHQVPMLSKVHHLHNAAFSEESFLLDILQGPSEVIETLQSFSNKNDKIRSISSNELWVFRQPNPISNLLSNREQEKMMLDWAYEEKLSLIQVKGFDSQKGFLISPFLFGSALKAKDFEKSSTLKSALDLLHRLHSSTSAPLSDDFNPFSRYEATAHIAAKRGVSLPTQVHITKSTLEKIWAKIPHNLLKKAPCHNDPSPENFFSQQGALFLHDWEAASFNDPMWDLAHLSVIGQLDPCTLLEVYPSKDPLREDKITLFRPFIYFNTVVWASFELQHPGSTIPPHIVENLYKTFLNIIAESLETPSFQQAIHNVTKDS